MDHLAGEEKKEGVEEIGVDCDDDEVEELEDLPPEIIEKIGAGRCFESEEALQSALVEAGVGDIREIGRAHV